MRTRIGSPFLLTIISIFSILFFATSVAAQSTSGEQCYSSKGREKDQLQNSSNPSSTNTKPKLVPESCGTTFDTYNPPAIACGANGNEP